MDLQPEVSLRRFRELGVQDIDEMLNPYRQLGVFHDLEMGLVGREEFVARLNEHAGTNLTDEEINEAIRRSRPASWVIARPLCRMNALRSNTSRLTPRSVSPQV